MNRCACVNVPVGSYANVVLVDAPPHMAHHRSPIMLDRCIAPEIRHLWSLGIETLGSCCGHGVAPPSIVVLPEHEAWMERLGYQRLPKNDPDFATSFAPKTITEGHDP